MHIILLTALIASIAPVQSSVANRQPELASAPGMTALVFGSGQSIWFSASHDSGANFSRPIEVTHVPVLALGRHRGPRVNISGNSIVLTAVAGQTAATGPHAHGLSQDGNLLAWRSIDRGLSWSEPVAINDVPGSAREGLHAIAASNDGALAAIWLDLRAPGTRLYGAFSGDHGASWSKNVLLYKSPSGTICQCCDPAIVFTGRNRVDVMFRDVVEGSRDMHLLTWQFNGPISDAKKLGTGSWHINACPMDGGGLAHRGGKTFTAWRRDDTVYLYQPGKAEIPLGRGKDVSLALTRKGPDVIWTGPSGIELWESGATKPTTLSTTGAFPTLLTMPDGSALAAWEDHGSIEIARVP
jgi:hypothetical protein